MKMNENIFFVLAKENGFEAADLIFEHSYSLSCSVFHKEVDSLTESDSYSVVGRGIVNGKFGLVSTEKIDKDTPEFLIKGIKETAGLIETNDPSIIFKGSEKYHKKNVFNKEVLSGDLTKQIEVLRLIEEKLRAYDKRIDEVAVVGYDETLSESTLSNSYGLKLKDKTATVSYYAEVTAKQGEEIQTGFKVFASIDPKEFDLEKFVKDVAEDALRKLGSVQCESKKYPTVLSPRTSSQLLKAYLSNLDAEEVEKKSSLFVGKLHQQIASKKLTVIEDPLKKNIFFEYHDEEGVATYKKFLIKKGILETYLYTLETAKKAGVEPTGNGARGARTGSTLHYSYVKPGKKSLDELLAPIQEGVYITNLEGLHAGMNTRSGNFSLQAQGFMIRNGKLAEPLSLITVAGNLVEVFSSIKEIGSDSEFQLNGLESPSIYIKKLAISGK
ncbi:MAG: TldD/PmbA family protein [Bacilli bacterium]|nr:TldD/PmbA family protein [Bacilli bacterium]